MAKTNYCTIYLVRHTETTANVKGIFQGHTDYPLTKKGIGQAKITAKKLKKINFSAIYSSDLLRAKRTAEIIKLERNLIVKSTHALRERSFGKFEGRKYEEIDRELGHLFKVYNKLPYEQKLKFRFGDNMETDDEIIYRFILFLREAAIAHTGKNILVVSHGGIIRHFLIHIGFSTNEKMSFGAIKNGAYVKILSDGVDFFVKETWNVEVK